MGTCQNPQNYVCFVWKGIVLRAPRKIRGRWAEDCGRIQRKKFMNTFTVEKTADSAYGGVNSLFYQHCGRSVEDMRKTLRKKTVQQSHHKKRFNSPHGRVHSFRNSASAPWPVEPLLCAALASVVTLWDSPRLIGIS